MQSFYHSSRDERRTSFFGLAIFSMLMGLFSAAVLYGHPSPNAAPPPPAAPGGLAATAVSNARVDLTWTDNAGDEAGFKIEIKIGAAGAYTQIATAGANVTSFSSTGLEASTQYFYRVRAYNASGNSAYSNEANATTLPDPPAAPGNLTAATVSKTQITLAWTDTSNNETGFKIERKLASAVAYAQIAAVGANVTSYASNGLTANTAYSYRVLAYNAGGNSVYSNIAGATTLPNPPAAPSNLAATTASNSRIDLAWKDNANTELGFIIERKTGAGVYSVIDSIGANVTSYSSTGLAGNKLYFYQVRAYNAGGHSAYSNEANAMTLLDPPAAPSNLTANALSSDQIDLAWTDNANNEEGFKIEIKIASSGAYTEIAVVGAEATTYSSTGFESNTQYFFRVRAYNSGGPSAYSNEASVTTLPDLPTAPSTLAAATVSNTQIDLTWTDNANNETGFKIERKLNSAVTYSQIATAGANVTSYASTGLNPNTAYSYRVRAFNTTGNSSYSNVSSATTLKNPPAAPSGLTAAAVSKNQIDLAWTDHANDELGFVIERKIGAAGIYAEIATVDSNLTSYSNTGLSANTAYFYRLRAFHLAGASGYSNEANAKTLPNSPAAPSSLTAMAASNSQINLAWTDNANNENGFKIERKIGAAGIYTQIASTGANVTSYSDLGLSANTAYFYRVRAHNAGGHSGYSNSASDTTLPNLPAAPDNLAATTVSKSQINLAWADSAGNEDGFKIERKTAAAGAYTEVAVAGANVTSYSNTGLSVNTVYFYRVRAYNAGGNSAYSNEANAKTLPNAPAAPGSLTATAVSTSQINLAWADSAANEDGFKIERKSGPAGAYMQIANVGANVKGYKDAGLSSNAVYCYRVRAFNAGGNSAYSNVACDTTLLDPPATPSHLIATAVSKSQINLAWTDSAGNEDSFKIERKTGAAGAFAQIAVVGANVKSYSNIGLNANTVYFYRVRAYNAGGHSGYSNQADAKTLPNAPTAPNNLTVAAVSQSQINLAWADNANNESGFKIERKIGAAGVYTQIATIGANLTSYSNTGLNANTVYFYRVCAYNAGGHSAYSNEASAATLPHPPAPPGNLTAAAVSNNKINLAWADNANNEQGFTIERQTGAEAYVAIATVPANVTNFADMDLSANTEYFYRVRADNAGGHSNYSNAASATTLPNPPTAPNNLTAAAVSQNRINLAWAENATNEDGFKIERKTLQGAYTQIMTVGANATSFADTSLSANTNYFYRVRAYNAGGHSKYSNEANATTLPNPPAAPNNLTAAVVSGSQVNLAWSDSANNEDGFTIERKTGAAGAYTEIATAGANVTSYASTGLTANTQYFYRVRAFNAGGHSAYSNEAGAIPFNNVNLALNKPITASSTENGYPPGQAVDGNLSNYWRSGFVNGAAPIAWLRVELSASTAVPISRAVVRWDQNYFATAYELQISNDGASWTTVYTENEGAVGMQDFSFAQTMGKFVRLYLTKNEKGNYRVIELEVYANSAVTKSANQEAEAAAIPAAITLAPNYPNPFNPATTISYALPTGMPVTLKVINIAGQEVATLVNGYREAGIYHVTFDAVKLPSGIYFAVLKAGEVTQVRRMMFAK